MFDDRRRLEDRIYRLRTGFAWSQAPASRTVRLITNVEVFTPTSDEVRMLRSNFLISEFWGDETRVLTGWAGHRVVRDNADWKIQAKQVNLIDCDQCIRNPSIILVGGAEHCPRAAQHEVVHRCPGPPRAAY